MNNNGKRISLPDFVVPEFFKRVDPTVVDLNPKILPWGKEYRSWPDARKIEYLEKLASSMNKAADLLQQERNALNEAIKLKEEQLIRMDKSVKRNNEMIQTQVTEMNSQRQNWNAEAVRLNKRIKELETQAG